MRANTLFGGKEGQAKMEPWIQREAIPLRYIKQLNRGPESQQLFGCGGESMPRWLNLNLSLKCPEYSFTSSTESFTEVPWLTDSMHSGWKASLLESQRPSQAHTFKGHSCRSKHSTLNQDYFMQVITFKRGRGCVCGGSVKKYFDSVFTLYSFPSLHTEPRFVYLIQG